MIDEIIGIISKIARQGRAFGINLVLSTQRPDADVVIGQIKSNMGYKICGKADDILSRIVVGHSKASEIQSEEIGRFINENGILIQGFFFDEDEFD